MQDQQPNQYQLYLLSPEWKQRRIGCYKRAGKHCEGCRRGNRLSTHHLTYERIFNEPLTDLMMLCERCHKFIEQQAKLGKIGKTGDPDSLRRQTLVLIHAMLVEHPVPKRKQSKEQRRKVAKETKERKMQLQQWRTECSAKWKAARKGVTRSKSVDNIQFKNSNFIPTIKY